MFRSSTTREGVPWIATPRAFFSGGPASSNRFSGSALTMTPLRWSVFWAMSGAVMPWCALPRPRPSFQPIFSIMRCAKLGPESAAEPAVSGGRALPGFPSLQFPKEHIGGTKSAVLCILSSCQSYSVVLVS